MNENRPSVKSAADQAPDPEAGVTPADGCDDSARQDAPNRFEFLTNRVRQFIWTLRPGGSLDYCNDFWREYTGLPAEAAHGSGWTSVVHADDLPATEAALQASLQTGRTLEIRLRLRQADGHFHWFFTRMEPVRDHAGRLTLWLGTSVDIDEWVRLEDALRKNHAAFQALASLAPVGIFRMDAANQCVYVNARWCELTGLSAEEAAGRGWTQALASDHAQAFLRAWDAAFAAGQSCQLETALVRPTGQSAWVLCQALPELSPAGRVLGYVGTFTDITQRKKSEEEDLALERRLQEAQKLESLAVLAGGIAHDFNNLLTGILGNASLARSELPATSEIQHYLQQIELASVRAAELCKQMLAYSGKGRFVVERLNLNTVVEETVRALRSSVPDQVTLKLDLTPRLPATRADAGQIRQALTNLLLNAVEAIGNQSGLVALRTGVLYASRTYFAQTVFAPDLPEGDYVVVEVSDNGCGMDAETVKKIFDPFFSTKFIGRGLGLAAVLGITRGHKGAIHVYSEAGVGSTFKILLPCTEKRFEEPPSGPPPSTWRGSGTILVVDDEELVRNFATQVLRGTGFDVLVAREGFEALELFKQHFRRIRLVLLDLTMPKMDGAQLFRELRAVDRDVNVLLMSGFNEQEAINRFAGRGLAGFLQKPFKPEMLCEKVQSILGSKPE